MVSSRVLNRPPRSASPAVLSERTSDDGRVARTCCRGDFLGLQRAFQATPRSSVANIIVDQRFSDGSDGCELSARCSYVHMRLVCRTSNSEPNDRRAARRPFAFSMGFLFSSFAVGG